jgi:tetratricopeptide (TPR) repeat protein
MAARQYQRSLDISERLGDQAGLANSYGQLGILAQKRGDYDEATRQYQRALEVEKRLGDQIGIAITYSQLGNLETDRSGSTATAIAWHVKALMIRLRLGVPQARNNLRHLSAFRRELGVGPFTSLLAEAFGDTELAGTVISWLDQWDKAKDTPA